MLRFLILLLLLSYSVSAQQPAPTKSKSTKRAKSTKTVGKAETAPRPKPQVVQVETVYVCTGSYATKYHAYSSCSGLNNCKGTVKEVEKPANGSPCKKCH